MRKKNKKRICRLFLALIALITCACFATVAASAKPYYDNTFKFLNHNNLYSCVTFGTETWYINNGGWFRAQDTTMNGEKFRFAQYNVGGFKEAPDQLGENPNSVVVGFGVYAGNISVPAGGIIEVKFDWFYNITTDLQIISNLGFVPAYKTARQVPITAMKSGKGSGTYFRLKNVDDNSVEKWYTVYPEVVNHGLYSGDFYSGNAVYRSTIKLTFKNTSGGTLSVHDCQFTYDPQQTFYNRNMREWVDVNNGGVVPALDEITAIIPVKTTYSNWISMGYGINDVPSYRVIQPEDVEKFEQKEVIGDPSGHDYDDFDQSTKDVNDQMSDANAAEDAVVGDMTDRMDEVSDEILDFDNINDSIGQLSSGFALISSSFSELIEQGTPVTFRSVLIYAICGGVLLTVVGQLPGIVNGVTERVARRRAEEEKRGIWKNQPKGNPAEWHGNKAQARREIDKFLDD